MRTVFSALALILFATVANGVYGAGTGEIESDFRCGTHIVSKMDQSIDVLNKCGEPTSRKNISGAVGPLMERWVYGPFEGYSTILTFRDDVLIEIRQIPSD